MAYLFYHNFGCWNKFDLSTHFARAIDIKTILSIHVAIFANEDKLKWFPAFDGAYSYD